MYFALDDIPVTDSPSDLLNEVYARKGNNALWAA